ncbi:hypothetical protein BD779DRAFT_1439512 [Infundibulicybe gibba]|nr:hypothetical protein BD779DRAFT_1439512 [Infundibulicybe gibba]
MSKSNLPPLASNGVFSVSASALIDAPIEKVWSILLDLDLIANGDRGQTMVDESKRPLADQTPVQGRYLLIAPIHLPPTMGKPGFFQAQSAFEIITALDHENHRAAWRSIAMPQFLLNAERWQALSVDEATGKTKYETTEVFGGLFAYIIKFIMREKLVMGFEAMGQALKQRGEESV